MLRLNFAIQHFNFVVKMFYSNIDNISFLCDNEYMEKQYKLIGSNGRPYYSTKKGMYGGNRNAKCYGLMDCPSALRWIAKGYYVKARVFFANDYDALMAGYHPCAVCQREKYNEWKKDPDAFLEKYRKLAKQDNEFQL